MSVNQPEAVRRSHWARHWACAIDVLELLAAESAFTHVVGSLFVEEGKVPVMDYLNSTLKDFVFQLMCDQYRPGEHCWGNIHRDKTPPYVLVSVGQPLGLGGGGKYRPSR